MRGGRRKKSRERKTPSANLLPPPPAPPPIWLPSKSWGKKLGDEKQGKPSNDSDYIRNRDLQRKTGETPPPQNTLSGQSPPHSFCRRKKELGNEREKNLTLDPMIVVASKSKLKGGAGGCRKEIMTSSAVRAWFRSRSRSLSLSRSGPFEATPKEGGTHISRDRAGGKNQRFLWKYPNRWTLRTLRNELCRVALGLGISSSSYHSKKFCIMKMICL